MKPTIRILLLTLAALSLTQCKSLRKFSPYEVYRSANVMLLERRAPEATLICDGMITHLDRHCFVG